jgi:hypothetical protein
MLVAAAGATTTPIDDLLAEARRAFVARSANSFADVKDPTASAEPFEFSFRPQAQRLAYTGGPSAFYSYSDGDLRIWLPIAWSLATIRSRETVLSTYAGQNAFGAHARVTRVRRDDDALLFEEAPPAKDMAEEAAALGVSLEYYKGIAADGDIYEYGTYVTLPPAAAKALAKDARIVVRGTLGGKNGSVADCDSTFYPATLDGPRAVTVVKCWVRVRVSSVAIVNGSTGETLKEWPPHSK